MAGVLGQYAAHDHSLLFLYSRPQDSCVLPGLCFFGSVSKSGSPVLDGFKGNPKEQAPGETQAQVRVGA